jgi:hypothetical protein
MSRIIKLSVDLGAKLNVEICKKYENEKNCECQSRSQEELGTSDTESQE